jgi:hypothetical protein
MIRRFFIWRALRRMAKPRYQIDRRTYHGRFNAGFRAFLHRSKYWSSTDDSYVRRMRRRRRLYLFGGTVGMILLVWFIYESISALGIF